MTVAVALLLGAAAVAAGAPWLLGGLVRFADPVALLVGWAVAVLGVTGTAAAGLVAATAPAAAADGPLSRFVGGSWWAAVAGAPGHLAYRFAGWLAAAALAAAALRLGWSALRTGRARRARVRDRLGVLRALGTSEPGRDGAPATLWLRSDLPVAFSLGGRPGTVVLTDGVRRLLPPDAVSAVLAHERAHVRGRHHLIVACADVLAAAFPFVPLLRAAPAAVRELVELAADASAVRSSGADAVRAALRCVTGTGAPDVALAMGRTAVETRLRLLPDGAARPARRISQCGALAGLAAATPVGTAVVVLWAVSALAAAAM